MRANCLPGNQPAGQPRRTDKGEVAMILFRFCLGAILMVTVLAGCAKDNAAPAAATETPAPTPAPLAIIESPISPATYSKVQEPRKIDTVVVHYASAIYWFDPAFQKIVSEEGKAYATSVNLTPENLAQHKYDWQLVKAIFEAYKVSSHYAIARDGTIVRFVADNDRAHHAGRSTMPTDGREGVNDFSI